MKKNFLRITASILNPIVQQVRSITPSIHLQCLVTMRSLIVMQWLFAILLAHQHILMNGLIKNLSTYHCSRFNTISLYLIVNSYIEWRSDETFWCFFPTNWHYWKWMLKSQSATCHIWLISCLQYVSLLWLWNVNVSSGVGLLPSDNRPLPELKVSSWCNQDS